MKFWKLHGIGNDFVAIDGRFDNKDASDYSEYAKAVCHRKFSVGADGLLVVKNSDNCDVEMVYYNADGSRAAMCGNGLRCFVKFVYDNNIVRKEEFSVNTLDGVKKVKINLKGEEIDTIKVNMGNGSFLCEDIPAISNNKVFIGENIDVLDKNFEVNAMLMGVPHVVILVDDISIEEVCKYGPLLENDCHFPKKANIEFAQKIDENHIKMRVWERGAGETYACGTGACAVCVACCINGLTKRSVDIELLGGNLQIEWNEENNHIYMKGPAKTICKGEFEYDNN